MKVICFAALAFAATLSPALAYDAISPDAAAAYQGNNITVLGTASIRPAAVRHWGMEVDIRDRDSNALLIAYIPHGDLRKFPRLRSLDGQLVNVTGVVEMDAGQPEIRVSSPEQIDIAR